MIQADEEIREELKQCYIELYRCMTEKDLVSLASILDGDSFVLVHMTGMKQDKQAFIQAIKDAPYRDPAHGVHGRHRHRQSQEDRL